MSDTPPRIANGVGGQVRVSALPGDALDTRQMAVIECVRNVTGYPQGAPVHPFFLTLARSPAVFEAFTRLGVEALSLSGAAQLPAGLGEQVGERPGNGGAHG